MANTRAARKVAAIRRKLSAKVALPAEFAAFVALVTDPKLPARDLMKVTWSDPRPLLNADKTAVESFVPFLLFADGGVVALWLHGADVRVASCDSEGQHGVLAQDFREFVARLANPGGELLERLELEAPLDTRALVGTRKPRPVPASTKKAFAAWVASHALDANTPQTGATEALRKTLHGLALRMLEDGLSKVYKPASPHWSMSFRLNQGPAPDRWDVTYLDYGEWSQVPTEYGFAAVMPGLLGAMKTRKKSYELSINKDGHVFADRGNQLVLEPG
jgi:hypothetical protein